MPPSEWTRWRLRCAAASFLFVLAEKTLNLRNFAFALGAELAFFGVRMRRAPAQDLISLQSVQRIH